LQLTVILSLYQFVVKVYRIMRYVKFLNNCHRYNACYFYSLYRTYPSNIEVIYNFQNMIQLIKY